MNQKLKLLFVLWLAACLGSVRTQTTTSDLSQPTEAETPSATENPPGANSTSNGSQTPSATENPPEANSTSNGSQTPSATENPPGANSTSNGSQTPSATENPPEANSTSNGSQTPWATENPPEANSTSNGSQTPWATENPPEANSTSNGSQTPSATESPPVNSTSNGSQTPTNPNEGSTSPSNPTSPPDPCEASVCGQGSTCQPRFNQSYVCLCLAGDFYSSDSKSCVKAKVFPGQLNIPGLQYNSKMSDTSSAEFRNASERIIDSLNDVFKDSDGYLESTVLKLEEFKPEKRFWSRAESGISATVDIAFDSTADTTTEEVKRKIENATCTDCPLAGANFIRENLCKKGDRYPCDDTTTNCSSANGSYNCSCDDGYIKTNFSEKMCIACPSGQKVYGSVCVKCPFGYSGFNCNENWQLILVIVGSVLGGLLLITLILLPIVASISSKRGSKKNKKVDIGNPVLSQSAAEALLVKRGLANSKTTSVNGSNIGSHNGILPKMPRATTPRDRTNLEMTPRNSRQNLDPVGRNSQMYRDEYEIAPYAQTLDGPHNNPYAQRRPQINPYASRQGQSNPSYEHDDGRRFNY